LDKNKLLIGIKETAWLLDLAPQTIYNMLSKKTFPVKSVRIGSMVKFRARDVEKYVQELPTT